MNILAPYENNQSFYSIADFFARFTTSSERNFSLQCFIAPGRSKMVSLQNSDDAPVDLFLPPLVVLLFFFAAGHVN